MKLKLLALFLVLSLLLTGCQLFGDTSECANGHVDADSDGQCDVCYGLLWLSPGCSDGHSDTDSDGVCDVCQISVIVTVDIYAVNDLHGKVLDTSNQPGIDELTTLLKNAKAKNKNTVFISTGDMWQGSFESNLTHGLMVTDWMNELGFASMTLGNHEFDWGTDYIRENAEIANFPILAINLYEKATGERPEYCESSVLIELNGIKVGIIGALGDVESDISADRIEDVGFKVGSELTRLVREESEKLRSEGADLVIYSLHDGYGSSKNGTNSIPSSYLRSYYDPILSTGYVDIVFEAHTHQKYILTDTSGVYHLQASGENKGISHAEIDVNTVTGKTRVANAEIINSGTYSKLSKDSIVSELKTKYNDTIAPGFRVLGTNSRYRDDSVLEATVASLYLNKGLEAWGDEYNIFLGGGFLKTRSPYNLAAGEVRYSDLLMLFPFDNEIVLCSISGYNLKRKFVESTKEDYYCAYSDTANIKNIDTSATYYVVVDSYTSQYESNGLTVVDTLGEGVFARDLLADYILEGGFN